MIAALLAVVAGVCLLVGFLADVHALGWVALGLAAVAGLLVLFPTRSGIVVEALVEPVDAPEPETSVVPEPPVVAPPVVAPPVVAPPVVELAETPQPSEQAPPEVEKVNGHADLVLVIPGRRRFHRPGCELLADHDTEKLTEEEAREEEFTPCTRCVS